MCLLLTGIAQGIFAQVTDAHVWVNEFRYDNQSSFRQDDQDDFIELIVSNQLLNDPIELAKVELVLYTSGGYDLDIDNSLPGKGLPYSKHSILYTDAETFHNLAVEDTDGIEGFQRCSEAGKNYTVLTKHFTALQDIPTAFALIYDNQVVQLISYEKAFKIENHADAGAAMGMSTTLIINDLGLVASQNALTLDNHSIQLLGTGASYGEFDWNDEAANNQSLCSENAGQTIEELPCIPPSINTPTNQAACGTYTFPEITGSFLTENVAYFSAPGGTGTQYAEGDVVTVTETTTFYIFDMSGACMDEVSFDVDLITITIDNPGTQDACDSYTLPTIMGTNLTGGQAYYNDSQANNGMPISGNITTSQMVWIYDASGNCSAEESFMVNITPSPQVDDLADVTACDSYTLPAITGSNLSSNPIYNTANDGSGTTFSAGQMITTTITLFIYDINNGCSSVEDFTITINTSPTVNDLADVNACDSYTLPAITGTNLSGSQAYYTLTGGNGVTFNENDVITETTTLFIYDISNGCNAEESVIININMTPSLAPINDITSCGDYTLPAIVGTNLTGNQRYYDAPGGTGNAFNAGDVITSNTTLYAYDATTSPVCFDEESFTVTLGSTQVIDNPGPQTACGSFTFPTITGSLTGNEKYYSMPNGGGDVYEQGMTYSVIGGPTTFYIFDASGATCSTEEEMFDLTVNAIPSITNPGDQTVCDTYTLPTQSDVNTKYYSMPNGGGTELTGNLTTSQTVYIFGNDGTCTAEESFTLNVIASPSLDNPGAQTVCDSYTLPTQSDPSAKYYSMPNAGGTELSGTITSVGTITVHIYAINGSCVSEENFDVTINASPKITNPGNATACDSYTLPSIDGDDLQNPQYRTAPNGGGNVLTGNLTTTQTVYIYDANGTCTDEESFEVTINATPQITNPGDQTVCESYTLPTIMGNNLQSPRYYSMPGGNGVITNNTISSAQTIYIYDANGICTDEVSFDVIINDFTAGMISGEQEIETGENANTLTEAQAPTGAGTFSYQWQSRTSGELFSDIDNANMPTYNPGMVTQTTTYRRVTTSTLNGNSCDKNSNEVTITVRQATVPVEWLYVQVNLVNKNQSMIEWATSSELLADGFYVEWSLDGKNFRHLAYVKANNRASAYEYLHETPLLGTNYYRIIEVDLDGKIDYSDLVSVEITKEAANATLSLFPNPTTDQVNLVLPQAFDKNQEAEVYIFDLSGQLVLQTTLTQEALNLSPLAAGVYQVTVIQKGLRSIGKVIKMD